MENTYTPPAKIPLINGLRGLAILGVILHHLSSEIIIQGQDIVWYGPIPFSPITLLTNSYQGVTLFFILSGFVLALPYAEHRRNMTSRADVLEFFKRRAARLLPLYYLAVLIGLILVAPTDNLLLFAEQSFFYFTGLFSFTQDYFFPALNFVLWSLSLEIIFCAFFPFIIFAMRKFGVWQIVTITCIAALAARFAGFFLIKADVVTLFTGTTTPIFNNIFCRIDDFVLGMGLAVLYVHKPTINGFWFYVTGVLSLLIGFTLRDITAGTIPLYYQPFSNIFINVGFSALLAVMLLQPQWLWKVTIENRVLQLIGLMSYSIFVWHGIAIAPLDPQIDIFHFARYAILVFALSFLTYRYIEMASVKPLRDILPKKSH